MKSPKPPDPYKTAQAQFGSELGAAGASSIMNNPNVYNPYGSQTYDIAGYETIIGPGGQKVQVPRYNQRQQLSPEEMAILVQDQKTRLNLGTTAQEQSAKLQQYLKQGIDPSQWQAWNAGPKAASLATTFGDAGAIRQDQGPTDRRAIEDAMIAQYQRQAGPREAAEQAQLTARGASAGTPMGEIAAQRSGDQFTNAAQQAYLASGGESRAAQDAYNQAQQQRYAQALGRAGFSNEALTSMFNMGGSEADRHNALRNMQASQAFGLRNQPINEIMALLGGAGVNMPQFQNYQGQGVNAPDLAGLISQNYQTKANSANSFNSGLFGMGATVLGGLAGGPMGAMLAGGAAKGLTA